MPSRGRRVRHSARHPAGFVPQPTVADIPSNHIDDVQDGPPSYQEVMAQEPANPPNYQEPSISARVPNLSNHSQAPSRHSRANPTADGLSVHVHSSYSGSEVTVDSPDLTRNRVFPAERQSLLPQYLDVRITYDSINFPSPSRVRIVQSRHTSHSPLPSPATAPYHHPYTNEERTPLPVVFMGLVMMSCISWVIITVIMIPCTEARC